MIKLGCNNHRAGIAAPPLDPGLIIPIFNARPTTRKTDSMLHDFFLQTYCFKEDVSSEKPCIARAWSTFCQLFLSYNSKSQRHYNSTAVEERKEKDRRNRWNRWDRTLPRREKTAKSEIQKVQLWKITIFRADREDRQNGCGKWDKE